MQPTASLQRGLRRLRLTTKMTNKGYYKGTGSGSMGRHTKHGGYIVEPHKVRTYVCPDLSDFKLSPFVTQRVAVPYGRFAKEEGDGPMSGVRYFNKWLDEGSGQ